MHQDSSTTSEHNAKFDRIWLARCFLAAANNVLYPGLLTAALWQVGGVTGGAIAPPLNFWFSGILSKTFVKLESNHSLQVPPPRQCYSPGGVTIFALPAVSLMPPLTQW